MPKRVTGDGGDERSGEARHRARSGPLHPDGPDRIADVPAGAGIRVLDPKMTLAQCEQVLQQMAEQIRSGIDLGSRRDHIAALHASLRKSYAEAISRLATVASLITGDTPQARELRSLCQRLHDEVAAGQAGLDAILSRLQEPEGS
ncbi:hypothetical protein [uncultured Methylobacterium sp.]|jgi:hypothetical protein|uniref:hypothetical protein n=1 Tax=uncultured Methylobacterium sp. TaxID=157278 RepID=UPI002633488F|nr:hypothetical protein [uncultured Methylobacterium sp.]